MGIHSVAQTYRPVNPSQVVSPYRVSGMQIFRNIFYVNTLSLVTHKRGLDVPTHEYKSLKNHYRTETRILQDN